MFHRPIPFLIEKPFILNGSIDLPVLFFDDFLAFSFRYLEWFTKINVSTSEELWKIRRLEIRDMPLTDNNNMHSKEIEKITHILETCFPGLKTLVLKTRKPRVKEAAVMDIVAFRRIVYGYPIKLIAKFMGTTSDGQLLNRPLIIVRDFMGHFEEFL
jgi:hypothetical protein